MDKDDKFWFSIWSLAAAFLITIVCISSYNSHREDQQITDLITSGKDPILSYCAIKDPNNQDAMASVCITYPLKKKDD